MPKGISETAFASQVEDLLKIFQWRWCHFRPARTQKGWRTPLTGDKGLPDYIAVRGGRLIFAELKDRYSKPTPEQEGWLEDLRECVKTITTQPVQIGKGTEADLVYIARAEFGLIQLQEVYLWKPQDYDEVKEILE